METKYYYPPEVNVVPCDICSDVLSGSPGGGGIEGVDYEDWNNLN